MPSTTYIPMNPSSVKIPFPADTIGEVTVRRPHQPVNQPGLPPDLRRHPARRIRDVWEREAQHQNPQQPARIVKASRATAGNSDNAITAMNSRPQPHHDVIAEIEQRDVVRPFLAREVVQPFTSASQRR